MKTKYVLITPARNEARFIKNVIKSIIAQTILPQRWLIIDDASTDSTSAILRHYEANYDFITSFRVRHVGNQPAYVHRIIIFLKAYDTIKDLDYHFLGSLDADLTFEPTYYENIMAEFNRNPKLGIASGVFNDVVNGQPQNTIRDPDLINTPGGLLLFRRECYEAIGGYCVLKYGAADSLAGIMARMNGWETRSFPRYRASHHRLMGTAYGTHILKARFQQGLAEHGIATRPAFMLAKSLRRAILEKPYVIGSLARLVGFLYGYCLREEREIPPEAAHFVRKEQIRRLFSYLSGTRPS